MLGCTLLRSGLLVGGGAWLGGVRVKSGELSVTPKLPKAWHSLRFKLASKEAPAGFHPSGWI